ncbi:MAG: hypothetical protein C3F06_14545 [Candidatus Methanoperedenaceae archaeon]|nr:MAG: hypothetical protein C3F06_14545 [Candidatus Methanoperedenaceae archaeon]
MKNIALDIKILAAINIMIQIVLMILLFFAALRAKKRDVNKHCNYIKIAVLLQLAAIFMFMLPSFPGYKVSNASMLDLLIIFHHVLGSVLVGLWIYVNLVYSGYIRWPGNFRSIMRVAFSLWILAFSIGAYIYMWIYY